MSLQVSKLNTKDFEKILKGTFGGKSKDQMTVRLKGNILSWFPVYLFIFTIKLDVISGCIIVFIINNIISDN